MGRRTSCNCCPCTAARTCHRAARLCCRGCHTRGRPEAGCAAGSCLHVWSQQQHNRLGDRCGSAPPRAVAQSGCKKLQTCIAPPNCKQGETEMSSAQHDRHSACHVPRGWRGRTTCSHHPCFHRRPGTCHPPVHTLQRQQQIVGCFAELVTAPVGRRAQLQGTYGLLGSDSHADRNMCILLLRQLRQGCWQPSPNMHAVQLPSALATEHMSWSCTPGRGREGPRAAIVEAAAAESLRALRCPGSRGKPAHATQHAQCLPLAHRCGSAVSTPRTCWQVPSGAIHVPSVQLRHWL